MRRLTGTAAGGVLVALASVQFGAVVVLGAVLVRGGLAVTAMLAIRFAVAATLLFAVAAASRRPLLPERGERLRLAVLGVAGYSIEAALFFAAIGHGTATAVTLLFFSYPVLVAVASRLLGEKPAGKLVAGSLVATVVGASVVVLAGGRVAIEPAGIAFALASAGMFTLYLLGADRTMRRTAPLTASAWIASWASAGLLASLPFLDARIVPAEASEWLRVTAMGAGTGGAFVCLMAGLRLLGPVRTSIVAAAEPLSSAVLAVVFLDEPLRAGTAAGGVLILAGAVAASVARRDVVETEVP